MNWIFVLMLMISTSAGAEGGAVGNGGGFAACPDRLLYAYDYLLTLDHSVGSERIAADLNSDLLFIGQQLTRLNDPWADEFKYFTSLIYLQKSGAKFQWFTQSPLPLMWEPDLNRTLPSQCQQRTQAVYYFAPFEGVPYASYKYDPKVLSLVQAQTNGNQQISYLWVHEWLWNHFSRPDFLKLAVFNRLLHSSRLETMTSGEYNSLRSSLLSPKAP
jgi:hypothetical protein